MVEDGGFHLEDEPEIPPPRPPPAKTTRPAGSGAASPADRGPRPEAPPSPRLDPLSSLDPRLRRRLTRFVPSLAVAFFLVGWLCVGGAFWVFAPVGAAVGVFAAWRQRSDVVLGTVSALAGLGTTLLVAGVVPGVGSVLSIVLCGSIGFLAAVDDRLRGG